LFTIKRVDHVSFATWSVDEQVGWFERVMGLSVASRWRNEAEGYAGAVLDLPGGQMQFEVIEPIGDDSFVAKFLKARGPGFHHITVEVENIEQAAAGLREAGIEPFRGIHRSDTWLQTYIHPSDGAGALWQLFEPVDKPKSS
jgi:methylmalonyl-CoA/ethylmalonyl-CoA epimerase